MMLKENYKVKWFIVMVYVAADNLDNFFDNSYFRVVGAICMSIRIIFTVILVDP